MKVFASRRLPQDLLQPLRDAGWTVDMYERDERCPRGTMLERSADADAILAQGTDRIDRELIDNAGNLKVVACCSVGYDRVDLDAARSRGIVVCNAPSRDLIATTAEAAVALLLCVAKRITRLHTARQNQDLPPYSFVEAMGLPVRGRVSGIVGAGRIGMQIARIMRAGFGNSILYFSRSAKPGLEESQGAERRSLDDLLAASNFVFIALPLTAETENMIGEENLTNLGEDAIVINVARAGIVDDAALTKLLSEGQIFGAGLDVYARVAERCGHPNLVLTAHMANGENRAVRATLELAVENVAAVLGGREPPTPVT